MSKLLACESAACNAGLSATQREARLIPRGTSDTMRGTHADEARGAVSRELAVTRHVPAGVRRNYGIAYALYACEACAHQRVYGNSDTTWGA